ncbi:TetR family transcriptional regulator [Actinocorallia sp. B10E7]|uniref:TetR/AcrR family transcriptional regulator n=1 Tax=Actinocorallia sp. B10E7 TaxID=3153558 RepID=UPI00325F2AEC
MNQSGNSVSYHAGMSSEPGTAENGEQLLQTALRLFALLGYDNTTVDMIAETAGRDREAVAAAGGKAGLYRASMQRYADMTHALLDSLAAHSSPDPAEAHTSLDLILDFYFEHPEFGLLWTQRWLSDARDISDIEQSYRSPLQKIGHRLLSVTILKGRGEEDVEMAASLFDWAIHGFLTEGIGQADGDALKSDDPRARRRFRAYMHRLMDLLEHEHRS